MRKQKKIKKGISLITLVIYDLAGNTYEWTNEKFSNDRVIHGGNYQDVGKGRPVSSRFNLSISTTDIYYSFRVQLYIK